MRFAGDDTGLCFVKKRYAQEIAERMRILCAPKQQQITHGLGLVLKGTKIDKQRISILSRRICLYEGKVVLVR
jgi:hypothetical protein